MNFKANVNFTEVQRVSKKLQALGKICNKRPRILGPLGERKIYYSVSYGYKEISYPNNSCHELPFTQTECAVPKYCLLVKEKSYCSCL